MNKRVLIFLIVGMLILGIALPIQAQGRNVRLGDGYGITVPDGFDIQLDKEGYFVMEGDAAQVFVFTPWQLQSVVPHTQTTSAEYIIQHFAEATETDLTSDVTPLDVADRRGGSADWSDGRIIAVQTSDLFFGILWSAGDVSASDWETLVGSFNGRFKLGEPSDLTGKVGDDAQQGGAAGGAASSEACTVSTATRDTARLRVGPGENRGAIAFLPPNVDVAVTGRFETDGGDVWYQLDKEQAMPGTSANELWVSADEVDAAGGCDTVGSADAPPVIPGVVAPPPATGGSGGEVVVGGAVPLGGSWTVHWNATSNASCQGTGNISFPTSELTSDLVYSIYLTVRGDGSSFSDGSDTYTRTGPNSYFGTFTFDFGENAQLYINVVNNRTMNGSATGNFTVDGVPCSYTTAFTLTHN